MNFKKVIGIVALCLSLSAICSAAIADGLPLIDDFEAGLPSGIDASGISIGFSTFQDSSGSSVAISTMAAPAPGSADPNHVLKLDVSVISYAGFRHNFENSALDIWVSQDWSPYEGISFWLYGNNSGTALFADVFDNRNPGSTVDDAECWTADLLDSFSGWQKVSIAFSSMHRKEIGNGAPNDGFGLTEVYGWDLGMVTTSSPLTFYIDNVELYGGATTIPEPATMLLLGLGLMGLAGVRRFKD